MVLHWIHIRYGLHIFIKIFQCVFIPFNVLIMTIQNIPYFFIAFLLCEFITDDGTIMMPKHII